MQEVATCVSYVLMQGGDPRLLLMPVGGEFDFPGQAALCPGQPLLHGLETVQQEFRRFLVKKANYS
jgi:hypothetical protein